MIRISQLKLPVTHKKSDLEKKIYTTLKISSSDLLTWHIEKKSLDARKKPNLFYVYTIAANVQNEKRIIKKNRNKNITIKEENDSYHCTPTRLQISTLAPSIVPSVTAPFSMNFILQVPLASFDASEICSEISQAGIR